MIERRRSASRWLLVALVPLLFVEALALPIAVVAIDRPDETSHLNDGLRALAVALFVATGVLLLSRARVAHDRRGWATAIAYVVMALGYPLSWALAPIHADSASEALHPWMRMVCFVVAMGIIYRAVDRGRPPPRPAVTAMVSTAVIVAALVILVGTHQLTGHPLDLSRSGYIVVQATLAAAWLAVAAWVVVSSRPGDASDWRWTLALPFTLFAIADLVRMLAVTKEPAWLMASGTIRVTAGAVAVTAAAVTLQRAYVADSDRAKATERALAVTEQLLTEDEQAESRQRHDARSVVSAIHLAWATLVKYDGRLSDETRQRLRVDSLRELTHLREVIERSPVIAPDPVRLGEVLAPILTAQRDAGREVIADIDDCLICADPADLTVVLQTLLAVTGESRADRVVRIGARRTNGSVALVLDVGDGNGTRTDSDPAGYHACRRLMHKMNGDIGRDGPGSYVLTIEASGSTQLVEHLLQVADAADDVPSAPEFRTESPAVTGRRAENDHGAGADAGGDAPAIDDGEVDDRGTARVGPSDINATPAEHPRKHVRQKGWLRRDDGGEPLGCEHRSSDADTAPADIRHEVEFR